MGKTKTTNSLRSFKSVQRVNSSKSGQQTVPYEFVDVLNCKIALSDCPVTVTIVGQTKGFEREKVSRFKRKSLISLVTNISSTANSRTITVMPEPNDDHTLVLRAYHDINNRLIEIHMNKYRYRTIPRVLLQVIASVVRFQIYLTHFTIKQCRIDMYTIHELSKLLHMTNITDVCLDQSIIPEGNYETLLSEVSCLRNLSLSRCNINDVVCQRIATQLFHLQPASNTLQTLNLSSNDITNVGVEFLAKALRSNRRLRYLNLADNHIDDDGASHILNVLIEFPLTREEILQTRKLHTDYLKKKIGLYYRCVQYLNSKASDESVHNKENNKTKLKAMSKITKMKEHNMNREIKVNEELKTDAQKMVNDYLGLFEDPFSKSNVIVKNGQTYCKGNLALCYLNVAYNNLCFTSVQKLLEVVQYQQNYKNDKLFGLLKIVIEGNYIPKDCEELRCITELLKPCFGIKVSSKGKKSYSSRTSRSDKHSPIHK